MRCVRLNERWIYTLFTFYVLRTLSLLVKCLKHESPELSQFIDHLQDPLEYLRVLLNHDILKLLCIAQHSHPGYQTLYSPPVTSIRPIEATFSEKVSFIFNFAMTHDASPLLSWWFWSPFSQVLNHEFMVRCSQFGHRYPLPPDLVVQIWLVLHASLDFPVGVCLQYLQILQYSFGCCCANAFQPF